MKVTGMIRFVMHRLWLVSVLFVGFPASAALAQTSLQDINFTSLPGSRFEIELQFSGAPPTPEVFMLESPARLTMDFANVSSELEERRFPLDFTNAESVTILEAQGRTRMVVNLNQTAPYATRVQGNSLFVVLGEQNAGAGTGTVTVAAAQSGSNTAGNAGFAAVGSSGSDISGIDFRRSDGNSGQIVIQLRRPGLTANISQNGARLIVEFGNAEIDASQQTRLDVRDFATAVQSVSMYNEANNVVVVADIVGQFEYIAYQADNEYVISVVSMNAGGGGNGGPANAASFTGERIDLNFQNVEIRTVLQILADFNDFSLVVGDNVTGAMTLRLIDVPWDQALDMVLRPRGLGQRLVGSVLYIAPADEIAQTELRELEASRQTEALAPLVTEYIEVNYASAQDLLNLLVGTNTQTGASDPAAEGVTSRTGLLSNRGRASIDLRTNTIIVQDVQTVIDDIKSLLARLDIPVRQVLIEARIVNASTSFSDALGVRWGGAQTFPGAGDQFILKSAIETENALADILVPQALNVDLGVNTAGASSIAIGYQGNKGLLELELSALESSGNGEVIAQPKITTQDQQNARIESGLQIPYQAQAGGTAGGSTTEFVTAALSLDVTPQITPDGRIIMLLDIHQDSVVPGSGAVPAIATNSLATRVLVNDGDTIVLGGVFREEMTTSVTKTPLLGDLPYVGNLFKRTDNSETKTELLIFITPSIIREIL